MIAIEVDDIVAEVERYRADRQRPKKLARPLSDKMAVPGARRGYETK